MKTLRLAGFLATVVYAGLTLAAFLFYPQSYSPLHNWLSDLGNPLVNPKGAILYNAGCIAASLLLIAFYLGLNALRNGDRVLGRLLAIGQAAGVFASLALILAAIYDIGTQTARHSLFSMLLAVGLTWFLCFANTALLRHPGFSKWLGFYGLAAGAAILAYGVFFNTPPGEWLAIGMFIIYIDLLAALAPRSQGAARVAVLR